MKVHRATRRFASRPLLALAALVLLSGCASANKEAASTAATTSATSGTGAMAGMNMGAGSTPASRLGGGATLTWR